MLAMLTTDALLLVLLWLKKAVELEISLTSEVRYPSYLRPVTSLYLAQSTVHSPHLGLSGALVLTEREFKRHLFVVGSLDK